MVPTTAAAHEAGASRKRPETRPAVAPTAVRIAMPTRTPARVPAGQSGEGTPPRTLHHPKPRYAKVPSPAIAAPSTTLQMPVARRLLENTALTPPLVGRSHRGAPVSTDHRAPDRPIVRDRPCRKVVGVVGLEPTISCSQSTCL